MTKPSLDLILEQLNHIRSDLQDIKADHKLNTEFRLKATGIMGFVAFVATIFGGLLVWIFDKLNR